KPAEGDGQATDDAERQNDVRESVRLPGQRQGVPRRRLQLERHATLLRSRDHERPGLLQRQRRLLVRGGRRHLRRDGPSLLVHDALTAAAQPYTDTGTMVRMPQIATHVIDTAGVQFIGDWITKWCVTSAPSTATPIRQR